MMQRIVPLLGRRLQKHLDDSIINACFEQLPSATHGDFISPLHNKVTISALQIELIKYTNLTQWIKDVDQYMKEACVEQTHLVCFPELFGLSLLFLLLPFRMGLKLNALLSKKKTNQDPKKKPAPSINVAALWESFDFLYHKYMYIMSKFAQRYHVYLSTGTVWVLESGRIYNRHVLLDPLGKVIGTQDKLHLVKEEIDMGFSTGKTLTVVKTPIGNIGLCVCMDATYFETFKVASALGADYMLVPIGNMEHYDHYLAYRGVQSRVSETSLIGIKSALVAKSTFPLLFTGKAGVYYPMEYKESVESRTYDQRDCIRVTLDLEDIRSFHSNIFCLPNKEFNGKYLRVLIQDT